MVFSALCFSLASVASSGDDPLAERSVGVLGARQRRFLGGEGAGERGAALHEGGARLIDLLELGFALDALGFEIGHARLQGVALVRDVADAPVVAADLLGAGEQMLARLAQQLFGRRRARLQGVEAHALAGEFVLVTLVGLVERADQPRAFVIHLGEIGFDVAQAALRGVEARLGLGQLARQAGGFRARLVERALLRALLVLGHQQALARGIEIGFERDDALVGGDQPLVEPAVLLAQRLAFRRSHARAAIPGR